MTILGIDYGTKKIGLALAEGKVATPLRVVRYESRRELRDAIRLVCDEYVVRSIVVGIPRDHEIVDEFIEWLRRELTLPVVTEDERLTTAFAKRLMRDWNGKADDDAIAATLILQSYIERTNTTSSFRTK
ncbi:MAG: Holliday junction resolvase RuvX [bacterium]|nr:Holliday junction resolvase RuvX [bacterium]